MKQVKLSRDVGLTLLLLYGLGNILGAGIYVLIGKVAGIAGYFSLLSFILACIIALFTAFSYMELASRYPVSAGVAVYVQEGFGSQRLSTAVGLIISIAGLVSSATLMHGFVGYLTQFVQIDDTLALLLIITVLVSVAIRGIKLSAIVAGVLTLIEIFGLLLIIMYGIDGIIDVKIEVSAFIPEFSFSDISVVFLGAFIAFYAFIGFEDMVTIAEEVKEPHRTYPWAIGLSLGISTLLYVLVLMVALDTLSLEALKNSKAPFADIYATLSGHDPVIISLIGMFAVINGALIQIIMASRILYGMAVRSWIPTLFSRVSERTKTPVYATLLAGIIVLLFALAFDIVFLAGFTSILILVVFILVNGALIRVKGREPDPEGVINVPLWVPWTGLLLNVLLMVLSALAA